jgi:hypothetical protein
MKQRPNKSKAGRKPGKTPGQNPRVEPAIPLSPRRKWLFRFIALVVMPLHSGCTFAIDVFWPDSFL